MSHDLDTAGANGKPTIARWRPSWRDLVLAAAVGAGIGVILWMADPGQPFLPFLATAVWIGLWIYLASGLALAVGGRWLREREGPALWITVGGLFFLGGAGGFLAALERPAGPGGD